MVTKDHEQELLKEDDSKVAPVLSILKNDFLAIFNNINQEIVNQYSNYYPNSFPLNIIEDSLEFSLNYIDV